MIAVHQSWEYQAAGAATMARQIILGIPTLGGLLPDVATDILGFLGSPLHAADTAIRIIERANNLACVLVNQCSYAMILQTGEQMDRVMEPHLPKMANTLRLFGGICMSYSMINPLGGLAFGDRKDAYYANMSAYSTILNHWHNTWEWVTTTVTEVTDGDTIHVAAFSDPVRVEGIDCPEICHEEWDPDCSPDEPRFEAGYAAKDYAESLLIGETPHGPQIVELRARKKRDCYDRILAKVFIGGKDGVVFGTEMVKAGHAKFYTWCFPTTLTH